MTPSPGDLGTPTVEVVTAPVIMTGTVHRLVELADPGVSPDRTLTGWLSNLVTWLPRTDLLARHDSQAARRTAWDRSRLGGPSIPCERRRHSRADRPAQFPGTRVGLHPDGRR